MTDKQLGEHNSLRFLRILFIMLFINSCYSQEFYETSFFIPENDSLLWHSPLTPRQVIGENIKKAEIRERKWVQVCKNCPDHPSPRMMRHYYRKFKFTFLYDSLGYPEKIVLRNYRKPLQTLTYKCMNNYDEDGHLMNSTLVAYYSVDGTSDTITGYRRIYSERSQLLTAEVHLKLNGPAKKREYRYNKEGQILQLESFNFNGSWSKEKRESYDHGTDSRIARKTELSKFDKGGEAKSILQLSYIYNKQGQDSIVYRSSGTDTAFQFKTITLESGPTGTLLCKSEQMGGGCELNEISKTEKDKTTNVRFSYGNKRYTTWTYTFEAGTGFLLSIVRAEHSNVHLETQSIYLRPHDPFRRGLEIKPNAREFRYYRKNPVLYKE